ncbi:hypothetical protein DD924_21010 [Staphylococcus pseudintermedius]|uniref:Uncharacterized protein n=1 Tax=Staphylococcus pseudintermedius TaxID=283734 RepID=A0A317Z1S1_STAPS|nr:hypothetical protein DD924_21010 [Staphylococcus pseudintermedius]
MIVDNASKKSITYTRGKNTNQQEILNTAKKLSKLIKMDTSKITLPFLSRIRPLGTDSFTVTFSLSRII